MALKVCAHPDCPELTPRSHCPAHAPKPWARSTPRSTLSGSAQQKRAARILRAHDGICHICGLPGADEVDHVIPTAEGGADEDRNLRPIHSVPCHQNKTLQEAARARSLGHH